jgi:3'-phosphoadenosine 5'-phosphosulfate sulfotransferase (PAPS reductase)/FAD synthetase
MRKGFFGKGRDAHAFAYRVLKAQPFRKTISSELRKGKRGHRVLLLNGAYKAESAHRAATLRRARQDPAAAGNIWFNLIHDWPERLRDEYLESRGIAINPVAKALCRSGECMCGTMQSKQERIEAKAFDPDWGQWIDDLEEAALKKHGWGWGQNALKTTPGQPDLFMPMCVDCSAEGAE